MRGAGNSLWGAVAQDFADLADLERLTHVVIRLAVAALLGGLLGYEREQAGKAAGLRTYMLVSIGAAFFVIVPQLENLPNFDLSRVVQGVITGIGFVGAGAILKMAEEKEVKGVTTAAGIWFTAGIGIAVGFGRLGTALVGAVFALFVLHLLARFEPRDDSAR